MMANTAPASRKPGRWPMYTGLIMVVVAVGLITVLIIWFVIPRLLSGLLFGELPLDAQTAKSFGPSRPLSEILAVAQEEARRIDKDVVLSHVQVSTVGFTGGAAYSGPTTGSLQLSFDFYRPTGKRISIDVEDADPRSTVEKYVDDISTPEDYEGATYQNMRKEEQDRIALLLSYKLTPRDAVAKTWKDSQDYARKNGLATEHVLPLISPGRSESGTPIWELNYWYQEGRATISLGSIFDIGDPVVSYVVDGVTGEIISSEYGVVPPRPTVAP